MTDEVLVEEQQPVTLENVEVPAEISEEQEIPRLSKHEELALSKGWVTKDKFVGDQDDWRPAKEWIDRGELLDTIHSLKRSLKEQGDSLTHLSEMNKKVAEVTRERTIAELENRHKMAVEVGDIEGAQKAIKDILKASNDLPIPTAAQAPQVDPAVHNFVSKHSAWFNDNSAENSAMKAFAIKRDAEIMGSVPGMTPAESLQRVEAELKQVFPKKFTAAPTHAALPPSPAPKKSKEISESQLPDFHKKMIKNLERSVKNFDKKVYINHLRTTGQI